MGTTLHHPFLPSSATEWTLPVFSDSSRYERSLSPLFSLTRRGWLLLVFSPSILSDASPCGITAAFFTSPVTGIETHRFILWFTVSFSPPLAHHNNGDPSSSHSTGLLNGGGFFLFLFSGFFALSSMDPSSSRSLFG